MPNIIFPVIHYCDNVMRSIGFDCAITSMQNTDKIHDYMYAQCPAYRKFFNDLIGEYYFDNSKVTAKQHDTICKIMFVDGEIERIYYFIYDFCQRKNNIYQSQYLQDLALLNIMQQQFIKLSFWELIEFDEIYPLRLIRDYGVVEYFGDGLCKFNKYK